MTFRLTLIHPCVGRRPGQNYIKTWQMEPLPPALIAGLTPKDVDIRFYDDRMELIPFDEPTDLVAISIETYTAKRTYQIASEYRRRGVPVVMGGFHASLVPDEVERWAESVIVGEAEGLWEQVLDDYRHGTPKKRYQLQGRPTLEKATPDRSIFDGKRYLKIGLIEASRGCPYNCEFCAIQTVFQRSQTRRPLDHLVDEVRRIKDKSSLIFFVDDNLTIDYAAAKDFMRALIPLNIKWVSQVSIDAAHDEELLDLMVRAGCMGVLIGFESLNPQNLHKMNKGFNLKQGGPEAALAKLRAKKIRLYVTFVFGYDEDTPQTFASTVDYAKQHAFYITAFNHLTPFPGTPLYKRLEQEGRLRYDAWWLDEAYAYNTVPFMPAKMSPEEVQHGCVEARRSFYSVPSILKRSFDPVNRSNFMMWRAFYMINAMHRADVDGRDGYPLGDAGWQGELIEADGAKLKGRSALSLVTA